MSHHVPYYAHAPLGQAPTPPAPVPMTTTSTALTTFSSPLGQAWRVVGLAAGAALAYHGYRRNGSIGWALVWALAGGFVWPIGLGIAAAQGFGQPALRRNRSRRRR